MLEAKITATCDVCGAKETRTEEGKNLKGIKAGFRSLGWMLSPRKTICGDCVQYQGMTKAELVQALNSKKEPVQTDLEGKPAKRSHHKKVV